MPAPDVETLLGQMTLDEKIGQMTQIDKNALHGGREVHDLMVGSVLSGADSLPHPNAADTWAEMYDGYQSQALSTRLGIPMIYGVDAVHGHGGLKGSTIFPHHIGLGCTRSPEMVQAAARVTAREVAGTGIDWTFAPCIAVVARRTLGPHLRRLRRDARAGGEPGRGRGARLSGRVGDGSTPAHVDTSRIMACAKHFLGDGGTFGGKDQGDTKISEEELRRLHLPGYIAAVKAGVATVMVSYSSWNGQPMHGNRHLITEVLKGELGFSGFVVSDWAAIDKMSPDYTPGHRALDQRRHRHGDGADAGGSLPGVPAEAQGAGRERARAAGAHRRRRPPHPQAEGALRVCGAAVHRPRAHRGDWLARAPRGRARRGRARAWWCSRTRAASCR